MNKQVLRWDYDLGVWREQLPYRRSGLQPYWVGKCLTCGAEGLFPRGLGCCGVCTRQRWDKIRALHSRAHSIVGKAKRDGRLPWLDGKVLCVDCGAPAAVYDHREYARPLDVVPVCRGCNARRGPALEAVPLMSPIRRRVGVQPFHRR